MYNIKLTDYVPAPKPAKSDRIIAAHYYAAWKKGAAGLHEGFEDLAKEYPERTPLMGYYDEENPEVCDWEIKWAVEHGINCFIYCWYRKAENMGKPITEKDLRCGHGLHEALFHAKYQQFMKFAIMFETSPRWAATDERDMLENLMPFWTETYFKRGNYLLIDNKPVVFIYDQGRLKKCFESIEHQRKTFDACREYAKGCGFDGMIFGVCNNHANKEKHEELLARGYDFRFGYNSGYDAPHDYFSDEDEIINGQCALFSKNLEPDPAAFIPTPTCFWDSTPRFIKRWNDLGYSFREWFKIWYLSPEKYRELLKKMKAITDSLPEGAWGKKIMMIDNWNEWDEGHYVAPNQQFGFQYLQAIREALTECNNLPDYRSPQDQGFGGYNRSWSEPDFSALCQERINHENKR